MSKNKTRLAAVSGATLALVIASTASVAALGPRDDDDRQAGRGMGRIGAEMRERMSERGAMRGQMRAALDDFERREVTLQTADGISVSRVENGVAVAAVDTGLDFSLASGESVTVTIDEDTEIVAFSEETVERRGRSRQRMVPTEVALADIEAGAQVTVWSNSEDGSDFVASRIVLQPVVDAAAEDAAAATETEVAPAEEAAATDA